MRFYVYRHIRLDSNTPFYIGKGSIQSRLDKWKYKRAYTKGRNTYWDSIVNSKGYKVEILKEFNCEQDALEFEITMIKLYKSLGYCEANFTDGGDGTTGNKRSKESRQNMSNIMKGRFTGSDHKDSKAVINKETNEIFESITEAAKRSGVSYGTMHKYINKPDHKFRYV